MKRGKILIWVLAGVITIGLLISSFISYKSTNKYGGELYILSNNAAEDSENNKIKVIKEHDFKLEEDQLTKKDEMELEMVLGLRKIKGVNLSEFEKKYHQKIINTFKIDKLLEENRIEDCKRIAKDPEFCQHLMEEFGIE